MEPLNLPRGTVRAIIVILLVAALPVVCIVGNSEGLAAFTGIAGFVIRDYFATRQEQNRQDGPPLPPPVA